MHGMKAEGKGRKADRKGQSNGMMKRETGFVFESSVHPQAPFWGPWCSVVCGGRLLA